MPRLLVALFTVLSLLSLSSTFVTGVSFRSVSYPLCTVQLHDEAFAALGSSSVQDPPENYLTSTEWISNGQTDLQFYKVKGVGYVCVQGAGSATDIATLTDSDTVVPIGYCKDLTKPPLALYQCIPMPALTFAAAYLCVGIPCVLGLLIYLHFQHAKVVQYPEGKIPCVGDDAYGVWPYFFGDDYKKENSPYYTDERKYLYIRALELEHSFYSFFFKSPDDRFHRTWRALVMLSEQALNFSIQIFLVTLLNVDAVTEGQSILNIMISIGISFGLSTFCPVRRLVIFLSRKNIACITTLARLWLYLSALIWLGAIIGFCTYGAIGNKGGNAPSESGQLMTYSFIVYVSGIPIHFFIEAIVICCILFAGGCLTRCMTIDACDTYMAKYCLDFNGEPHKRGTPCLPYMVSKAKEKLQLMADKIKPVQASPTVNTANGHTPQPSAIYLPSPATAGSIHTPSSNQLHTPNQVDPRQRSGSAPQLPQQQQGVWIPGTYGQPSSVQLQFIPPQQQYQQQPQQQVQYQYPLSAIPQPQFQHSPQVSMQLQPNDGRSRANSAQMPGQLMSNSQPPSPYQPR